MVDSLRELCKAAEDHGIVLAMQNHGPDIVNRYQDVLALIDDVGSPALKACMDINIEPEADSAEHAREMVGGQRAALQVHSHFNAEFRADADGRVELAAGGYFDDRFWARQVAYPPTWRRSSRPATTATWTGSSATPLAATDSRRASNTSTSRPDGTGVHARPAGRRRAKVGVIPAVT